MHFLAEEYHTGETSIIPLIMRPLSVDPHASIPPKFIKSRLDIVLELLTKYGMSSSTLTTPNHTISFSKPFASHGNADVRGSAASLLAFVGDDIGETRLFDLLEGLEPNYVEAIKKKLKNGSNPIPFVKSPEKKKKPLKVELPFEIEILEKFLEE